MGQTSIWLAVVAAAGIVVGIALLFRGFSGYLSAGRITGTSPSRIASIAVGEVLVTGTVEAAEVLLVSPLQSTECVYYRSRVTTTDDRGEGRDVFRDDRAVGFRVRDPSGSVRVFPRGARFDVPDRYDERSGSLSDAVGLRPRLGPLYAPGPEDGESRIAELLTVHHPSDSTLFATDGSPLPGSGGLAFASGSRRRYREARIEPGDVVTVIGKVLPFSELSDPTEANLLDGAGVGASARSPAIWPRRARRDCSRRHPRPPGGTPRFPASASGSRSASRSSIRAPIPSPSPRRRPPPGPRRRSRSGPRR